MFSIRNREDVERLLEVDEQCFELVGKRSTLMVAVGGTGFSWSYRRPKSVTNRSTGSSLPVRDHVMTVRLLAALVLLLAIARRYVYD